MNQQLGTNHWGETQALALCPFLIEDFGTMLDKFPSYDVIKPQAAIFDDASQKATFRNWHVIFDMPRNRCWFWTPRALDNVSTAVLGATASLPSERRHRHILRCLHHPKFLKQNQHMTYVLRIKGGITRRMVAVDGGATTKFWYGVSEDIS
jgi:hypothetical protein